MDPLELLALMVVGSVFGMVSAAILVSLARALTDYILDRLQ